MYMTSGYGSVIGDGMFETMARGILCRMLLLEWVGSAVRGRRRGNIMHSPLQNIITERCNVLMQASMKFHFAECNNRCYE